MNNAPRNDEVIQAAARNLFEGAAPERLAELKSFWEKYQPRFNVLPDAGEEGDFILDAGAYRDVRFNHRVMRAFWVSSFAAWEAYSTLAISIQGGIVADLNRLKAIVNCVGEILESDIPESVIFPEGIPEPGTLVDASLETEARAAGELAILAVGWALLHEVKHIQHQQDGSSATPDAKPEDCHREEISCDEFATSFLLDTVDAYAEEHNEPPALVRQKRQTGIYFALFSMTLMSRDKWGQTKSHPALQERIDLVARSCRGDGSDVAAVIAHLSFLSLKQIWPNVPGLFVIGHLG
ncbi:MAG: phage exclusion protein Lit family protein [Methylotenera sp.]|nr:phage exclusion protein Lit family protein [Methylotenera sp.]